MEGKNFEDIYIVLGSAILVVLVIVIAVFILLYKRRKMAQQTIIDMLQNECKKEIEELKKRVGELEEEKTQKT